MSHDHNSHASGHGNLKQYVVGFILSILLTVVPFWMVMNGGFSTGLVLTVIAVTAIVQVAVQLVFFLHLDSSEAQQMNVGAFAYTIMSVAILVIGSIWIMHHLHTNMMM